jgi:PAS domain S-box-containing protein
MSAPGQEINPALDVHELIGELRAREAELALIHRIAGVGGLEVNLQDGFRNRKSPEYLMIHGLSPTATDESHEAWVARLHPDDRLRAERQFLDAVAGTTRDYSAEYRIVRPSDGQTRWVKVVARIERDPEDRPLRLIGAHFDITDAKLAEQALRESEERFRIIANNAPIPMWVTKLDGERLFVNQAYAEFFGLSYQDALKLDWRSRVHPEDAAPILRAEELRGLAPAPDASANSPFVLEIRILRVEGEWRWVKAVSQARFDEHGRHVGFIGVAHDITIAKEAEIELRRLNEILEQRIRERTFQLEAREAQMRTILDTSNQYQCLLDREGRIQFANRTALASIGSNLDEVFGKFFWESPWFARTSQTEGAIRELFQVASRGELARAELSLDLPAAHRILEIGMRPIAETSGGISGVLVEGVDVTERRHNEEALRQSQKMEAVGQLTGGVAHDFNNLLTILNSATEFLQKPDLAADRRQRYLGIISDTVVRATKLTSQLLAFARRHPMLPQSFNVGTQMESIVELLQPVLGSAISVALDLQSRDCIAVADVGQFETAVVNLALNARDAMPNGGKLTFRVSDVDAVPSVRGEATKNGHFVVVSVIDTGAGIDPQLLARIFEPFFTTKQSGKGTGLGLSQAFGFSKQSGGELEVRSEPGQGSTFSIYLPRVDVPGSARENTEAASSKDENANRRPPEPSYRILLVEDNEDIGMLATEQLRALGQDVHWARDANYALVQLETARPEFEIMFSDIVMPGMNGIDLADHVSRKYPDICIVLTTGYSQALSENQGARFPLVSKPYTISTLLETFVEVMAGREKQRRVPAGD